MTSNSRLQSENIVISTISAGESEKIHFTEVDLDDYDKFDYIINNDGSIEELEMNIREVMRSENL